MKTKYAKHFDTAELAEHYRNLIGDPAGLTRDQFIAALKGTMFDEFAYDK